MGKYIFVIVLLLSGCLSSSHEPKHSETLADFVPRVWIEKNSKTGWYDLNLNTKSQPKITILTSKYNITNPIRSRDGELLAYISYENKQKPMLYLQSIYSAKRKTFAETIDNSSEISFSASESSIIVKTRNDISSIPINEVIK